MRPLVAGCLILAILVVAGCRGRWEFHRGQEYYQKGDFRQAYLHYWEAYNQSPSSAHLAAVRLAGGRVAAAESLAGRRAEAAGDLERALERYDLAIQYDPLSASSQDDYARAWEAQMALETLERRLVELRAGAREKGSAEELQVLRALCGRLRLRENPREDLRRAVRTLAEELLEPLRRATFLEPLSDDAAPVEALGQSWRAAWAVLENLTREEEGDLFSFDPVVREMAGWEIVRGTLLPHRMEVDEALAVLAAAARGFGRFSAGARLEAAGDLAGAHAAYVRCLIDHPGLEKARAARSRVLERLVGDAYQAARIAARGREWKTVLRHLEGLLPYAPEHAEARALHALARSELASQWYLEGRRFEDDGLVGNALIRYLRAFDLEPENRTRVEAIRRIEEAIRARLRPRVEVSVRAFDVEEARARRDLWGVSGEVLGRMEREVVAAAQSEIDASLGAPAPGAAQAPLPLVVDDFDFGYPQGESSPGFETARYAVSFQLAANPRRAAAAAALDEARTRLEAALAAEASAPVLKQAHLAGRLALARHEVEEKEARILLFPELIPALEWGSISYPTLRRKIRLEVAAKYRLEGETRWVACSEDVTDRVVLGDAGRNVAPDPDEVVSRAEAIRRLAPRLGRMVAGDAGTVLRGREEKFYSEGVKRLSSQSFDVAVENLVVFLCARRDRPDALYEEAARRLENAVGCSLPELWRRRGITR